MAVFPKTTTGQAGDPVFLDATGKLPVVDGSQLTGVSSTIALPVGNTIWVDNVNGNDGTGLRGREDRPFLTIQAALSVALTGDLVFVMPGTYSVNASQIVIPADVSLRGIDRRRCRISYTGASTVTIVSVGARSNFVNFDMIIQPTAGDTTCIDITTQSATVMNVSINPTSSGNVTGCLISSTGITNSGKANIRLCSLLGVGTGSALLVNGIGGSSLVQHSNFDGAIGCTVTTGTITFNSSRIGGTTGLVVANSASAIAVLDTATTITAYSVGAAGMLVFDGLQYPRNNYSAIVPPVASNDLTQGYAAGSRWVNTDTTDLFICTNASAGSAVWRQAATTATEVRDYILLPEARVTADSTRVCQTVYEGASYVILRRTTFNRLVVRVTATTAPGVVSLLLFQSVDGAISTALDRVMTCSLAPGGVTGTYAVTPTEGVVTLEPGIVFLLFGLSSATGSVTIRTLSVAGNDLLNQNVNTDTYPAAFTTAINANTLPSTFDPRQSPTGQASSTVLNVAVTLRLKNI